NGYFADTLPDYKAEKIKELQEQGHRVCFIGDGINDLIALRQAEVSISLRGATTIATDAAQVVLMDDDLAQLKVLWELTERFEHSIDRNQDQSTAFSLVAAAGVLLLPYKFWLVFLLGSAQAVTGIRIASRPLIDPPTEEDTDCPIQME
ncbi:MAG: HAD family hydrolase, partial [Gammaproteobacteria bacterium]